MKKTSKFMKIILIFIIIIINLQQIIYAIPKPDITSNPDYYETPSRASRRIVSAMIDLFQIHLVAVIIIFIILLLFLFISRLSKLIQVKKSIKNITNLEKINFDKEIKSEILNYSDNALYKLYFVNILTKIIYIVLSILVLIIASTTNLEDFLTIICLALSFLLPIYFIFRPLIKYVKKTEQIIKDVIYSKENLQNKEYYYAKEALRNIKRILPLAIIISILNYVLIWLFEISTCFAKPIIYLYPEKTTEVNVKLGKSDIITTSYPKYEDGWNVIAEPNGNLTEVKSQKKLYSLYWEGKNIKPKPINDGWCIKGEDVANFLEEQLQLLGLNDREAEEFIIYWLPILESNKYNLIRFETEEEINSNMPLDITPKPDTTIRVMMEFKGVNHYKELTPQQITTPIRNGFVVVEWGGTQL